MSETSRASEIDQRIRWIAQRMVDGSADSRDETEMQELIRERARNLRPPRKLIEYEAITAARDIAAKENKGLVHRIATALARMA